MKISYQITENLLGAFILMLALPASADNRSANEIQEGKNIQVIKKVINRMFETSEEGGNLAQMRLIWYQKDLLC